MVTSVTTYIYASVRGLSQISKRNMFARQLMCPRHSQFEKLDAERKDCCKSSIAKFESYPESHHAQGCPEISVVTTDLNIKYFRSSTLNSQMAAGLTVFRLSFQYLHFTPHESTVCQLQPAKFVISMRVYAGIVQHQVWPEILQNS